MKIGQFFILGFNEKFVPKHIENLILEEDLFGVILFRRNFENKLQLKYLINRLKKLKSKVSKEPLLIGIDSEGGFVNRFQSIITSMPSAFSQGMYNKKNVTKNIYLQNSYELNKMGINCNFAPVCDIIPKNIESPIGIRSFHYDVLKAKSFIKKAVSGIKEGGLLACAKHFPGLGKSALDTHFDLPFCKITYKNLMDDLIPFKEAINNNVDFIMTSHCVFPAIDNEVATFSKIINTSLLREKLKFKGLIITDDLCMGALSKTLSLKERIYKALSVGADSVLICHDTENLITIKDELRETIKNSLLIDAILKKERIHSLWRNFNNKSENTISKNNIPDMTIIKKDIAVKTLIWRKKQKLLISENDKTAIIMPPLNQMVGIEENDKSYSLFSKNLKNVFGKLKIKMLKENIEKTNEDTFKAINSFLKNHKKILLIGSYSNKNDVQYFMEKLYLNENIFDIVIFLKNPIYSKSIYKYCKNILFSLGFNSDNQSAIIDFIKKNFLV